MGSRVTIDEVLEHHGIKGMKWGTRKAAKAAKEAGPSSHDAAKATEYQTRAKTGGTKSLSNQELQHLVNRMNLEQNYSRLAQKPTLAKRGAKFTTGLLGQIGKQAVTAAVMPIVVKQIAGALAR